MIHSISPAGCGCHDKAAPCGCHGKKRPATFTMIPPAARARLGDTQCDQDGNCFTDGTQVSGPLFNSPAPSGFTLPTLPAWQSSYTWIALAAVAALIVFQSLDQPTKGRKRKR